jgi:hypothetical protein
MIGCRLLLLSLTFGCGIRPSAVPPPDIEPGELAKAAAAQYDSNGDGVIDKQELRSAPSLRFSLNRIDGEGNRDSQIQPEEVQQFAQKHWVDRQAGIVRVRCLVRLDGREVDGATVTLEPETFMGGAIVPAAGITRGGMAVLDVADEQRPHPNAHGAQYGLYLVRISKMIDGNETIPAKFNVNTILGCEVADRAAYMPGPLVFELSSRG